MALEDTSTSTSSPDPSLLHPAVATIISQVPSSLLSTLLTFHARAYSPQNIIITSLTPSELALSYDQPVEDLGFKPVPRTFVLKFEPPLPPLPSPSTTSSLSNKDDQAEDKLDEHDANYTWERACATRLNDMNKHAIDTLEDFSPIIVTRYLPPTSMGSYMSMLQFLVLTATIFFWIRFDASTPVIGGILAQAFNKEWKFNSVVLFHVAILVRKWAGVLQMAKKLRRHGVGRPDLVGMQIEGVDGEVIRPKGRVLWLKWLVTAFLEGWRCEDRFDGEVARVGKRMAEEEEAEEQDGKGRKKGGKRESKKKR